MAGLASYTPKENAMNLLLIGSSGLVGGHVLRLALADARITGVVALVRRPLPAHPKLTQHAVDFDALPANAAWWRADAVICTLGTTMKLAGSQAAFRRVDHDYPLAVAKRARQHGVRCYVLNSAKGADPASWFFYSRVKGELERELATLGFGSLTFVRPGLIGGEREEQRGGEHAASKLLTAFAPLLPRSLRINPAPRIAQALLDAAVDGRLGTRTVEADQLN